MSWKSSKDDTCMVIHLGVTRHHAKELHKRLTHPFVNRMACFVFCVKRKLLQKVLRKNILGEREIEI